MIITGKELLEKENLTDEIVNGLVTTKKQNYNGRLHVSSSGYCPRKGALTAVYDDDVTFEAKNVAYMEIGNTWEKLVLDALDKRKKVLFRQYDIPDIGINLGGKVDGIIIYNGKVHVLEVKSCGKLPIKPNPEHVSQLMVYSAVTGLPAVLVYASRNVADYNNPLLIKEFYYGFDREHASDCLTNTAIAYFASKNKLLPEIPRYITESNCEYCQFKNICWKFEPQTYLEPMSSSEQTEIENAADNFIQKTMSISEISKRRNGVLNYLSKYGNKTAKLYLENEDWHDLLIDLK